MKNQILIYFIFLSNILISQESKSFTIEESIDFALKNNVEIKKAELEMLIAKEKVKETKATGFPQISGKFDYNYNIKQPVSLLPAEIFGGMPGEQIPVTFGTKQSASLGATLTQLLFSGTYLIGLKSVKVYELISELAKEKTEVAIKEAVYYSYSGILLVDENIKILEKNITISKKNLNDITEINKVGFEEYQTVEQMQYNHSSLLIALNTAKEQKRGMVITLQYLMGIPIEESINLTTPFDELIESNIILVEKISPDSFENHVDIKLADNEIKSNELLVKYQKSFLYPTVAAFLTSNYNAYSDKFDFIKQQWYNTTIVGLSVNIPIFSSFQTKNKIQQAKINLEKAEINKDNTLQNLIKEAETKKIDYENSITNFENSKKLIQLSESIFNKEQTKFYEGIGSSFDLTNAERQKYEAQNQYITSAFKVIQSKIALDKALGKL